jgi:hypothetical protein
LPPVKEELYDLPPLRKTAHHNRLFVTGHEVVDLGKTRFHQLGKVWSIDGEQIVGGGNAVFPGKRQNLGPQFCEIYTCSGGCACNGETYFIENR